MSNWTPALMPNLNNKLAVVTGANSGLGFQTTLELARHGAQVVLACRDRSKAETAMQQIKAQVPNAQLDFMPLDLADLESVTAFASAFKARYTQLNLLFNNAGVMALPAFVRTRQGFEIQFGTNHLGHFALVGQLLALLLATPGARIVNTASLAHALTRGLDFKDLNWEHKSYCKWQAYGASKLSNLLFTYELQRRLNKAGAHLICVAAHPGYAATNLQLAGPELANSFFGQKFAQIGNAVLAQPAEMGAYPQLYAGTMADVRGGDYFGPDGFKQLRGYPRKVGSSSASRNEEAARKLWSVSEQLTGIAYLSE